jgi:hypothetical protein
MRSRKSPPRRCKNAGTPCAANAVAPNPRET